MHLCIYMQSHILIQHLSFHSACSVNNNSNGKKRRTTRAWQHFNILKVNKALTGWTDRAGFGCKLDAARRAWLHHINIWVHLKQYESVAHKCSNCWRCCGGLAVVVVVVVWQQRITFVCNFFGLLMRGALRVHFLFLVSFRHRNALSPGFNLCACDNIDFGQPAHAVEHKHFTDFLAH